MAWTLTAVREAVATRLDAIAGLRGLSEMPATAPVPAAIVTPGPGEFADYDETFEGAATLSLTITLVVAKISERSAQRLLDEYIQATGAKSIKAAVDSGHTADWDWAVVGNPRDYGKYEFGTGAAAAEYLGCVFPVSVGVS